MRNFYVLLVALAVLAASCASTGKKAGSPAAPESPQEAVTAMETVVSAISGRPVSQKDLQDLGREIRHDEEARSAVATITNSLRGADSVKYCPVDGQRYSPKFETCPVHHVPLKYVDE